MFIIGFISGVLCLMGLRVVLYNIDRKWVHTGRELVNEGMKLQAERKKLEAEMDGILKDINVQHGAG
jgi:3-hydroxyacyl-CoA dehydrogenase